MPCSVVPPFTHNRYKTKRTRSAPCFLFVFPLLGRLLFIASQRIDFRLIIKNQLSRFILCDLVDFLCSMCGVVHIFCNIALNQSNCSYERSKNIAYRHKWNCSCRSCSTDIAVG